MVGESVCIIKKSDKAKEYVTEKYKQNADKNTGIPLS